MVSSGFREASVRHMKFESKASLAYRSDTQPDVLSFLAKDRDRRIRSLVAVRTDLPSNVYVHLSKDKEISVLKSLAGNKSSAIPDEAWENLALCNHVQTLNLLASNPNTPSHVLQKLFVKHGFPAAVRGLFWRSMLSGDFVEEFSKIYDVLLEVDAEKRQTVLDCIVSNCVSFLDARKLFVGAGDDFFTGNDYSLEGTYKKIFCLLTGEDGSQLPFGWVERVVEQMILNPERRLER